MSDRTGGPTRRPPAEAGFLDLRTLPLDPLLRQAVGDDPEKSADAWRLLGTLAAHDRPEAGTFLIGLMQVHRNDLARMGVLVSAVSRIPSEAAAEALKAEFLRVRSTPATRSHLGEVLRAIERLPARLASEALFDLAEDERLSVKWRRRLEEAADALPNEVRLDGPRFEE
ncbi:MAG: hypothetical protein L0323_16015 [Planctomycetes bacterium]|nr:hypothetical protein [Planctomycetota bacterium]